MVTQFNQQAFEDELYEFVTNKVNGVFPQLLNNGDDILKAQQQMLQSIHFVIEETITQIAYGLILSQKLGN